MEKRSSLDLFIRSDEMEGEENTYFDEEDLLGFKIWVAELELLVGGSKGKQYKIEPGACHRLLQKLLATIDRTDITELKEYQRRCEDALVDILLKGAPPPIRRLICTCLSRIYGKGDQLPLFSRVSSLQLFLGTKEAFGSQTSEDVRLGAMELMTSLYYSHGKSLAIGVRETACLTGKYCARSCSDRTRQAALRLLAATVEGVGGAHREARSVQHESIRSAERLFKEKGLGEPVRLGLADLLRAISSVGGLDLWNALPNAYDFVRNACISGVQDESHAVRSAFGRALGELVGAAAVSSGEDSEEQIKGPKDKNSNEIIEQCLAAPLAEALAAEERAAAFAISQAWVWFLTYVKFSDDVDDSVLLSYGKSPFLSLRAAALAATPVNPEKGPPGPNWGLGCNISNGERPFSQACILYIMRSGIIEQIGEVGQKELLARLTSELVDRVNTAEVPAAVLIAKQEVISILIDALGEIGVEAGENLEEGLAKCICHGSSAVRKQAASTLSALAVAEPGRVARMMGSGLNALRSAADALVEVSMSITEKGKPVPGTPRGNGSAKVKEEMNAVHGWAVSTACLLAAVPFLPLGIPSNYLKVAIQMATAFIEAPRSDNVSCQAVEREAGYILLGAICSNLTSLLQEVHAGPVVDLWAPLLADEWIDTLDTICATNEDNSIACELWWRCEALHALGSYLITYKGTMTDEECNYITSRLLSFGKILSKHKLLEQPDAISSRGMYLSSHSAGSLLQTRYLRLISILPPQKWIQSKELSSMCVEGLKNVAMTVPDTNSFGSLLMSVLDPYDAAMGPWHVGKDLFENELLHFQGVSGGIERELWSLRVKKSGSGYLSFSSPFPQSVSLADALLLSRVSILSQVIQEGNEDERKQILEALTNFVTLVPRKDKSGVRKLCLMTLAAAPIILSCRGCDSNVAMDLTSAVKVEKLSMEMVSEASKGVMIQRLSASLVAAAIKLADDAAAQRIVSLLCNNAASTSSLAQRSAYVMGIGMVSRALGGIGLSALLQVEMDTMKALYDASPVSIASVILHALTSISQSAGPAFAPYVKETLKISEEILLNQDVYSTPGLLPAIGKLGNSMVACLGPDYVLGSENYEVCRSIVSELRAPDASGVRIKEDMLASALESVLYAQMLVLFAPTALPTSQHIRVLVATLPSRQPQLRRAAADTLRHLSEKDTSKVLDHNIESALFAALDGETDAVATQQLQASLQVLLVHGAGKEPSRWIALLGEVATSVPPTKSGSKEENLMDLEDPGSGLRTESVETPVDVVKASSLTPRLRTRAFAAKCLVEIPQLCMKEDSRHCDALSAVKRPNHDWLVLSTEKIVDIGFRMATGEVDCLRSCGVQILHNILKCVGDSKDPLSSKELLMYQYQAQYVSALRASLSTKDTSPAVNAAGFALAASFLEKGIDGGDSIVMEKLISLLCSPLSLWSTGSPDPTQIAYAEWVAAGARVALLESHAICATLGEGSMISSKTNLVNEVITRAQGPFYTILVECWTGLMEDAVVLYMEDAPCHQAHSLRLYGRLGTSKAPKLNKAAKGIQKSLMRAWPKILDATSYVLLKDRTVSHGNTGFSRHESLFEILVAFTYIPQYTECWTSTLRVMSRLLDKRYIKEGWIDDGKVLESALIVMNIVNRISDTIVENSAELVQLAARILKTLFVEVSKAGISARTRQLGAMLYSCLDTSVLKCPEGVKECISAFTEGLEIHAQKAGIIENVDFFLFHSISTGLRVLQTASLEQSMNIASQQISHALKIAASCVSFLGPASMVDPNVPSVEEILTYGAEASCKLLLDATSEQNVEKSKCAALCILYLGSLSSYKITTYNGQEGTAHDLTPTQNTCLIVLDRALYAGSASRDGVFDASLQWLESNPPPFWAISCIGTVFPHCIAALVEATEQHGQWSNFPHLQHALGVLCFACELGGEFAGICIRWTVPLMVKIASRFASDADTSMASLSVKYLTRLATGNAASEFKSAMSELPEKDRLHLHDVIKSNSRTTPRDPEVSKRKEGLQTLDLSRFRSSS